MASVVVGTFDGRDQAERSVQELRNKGFDREISLVTRDEHQGDASELSMRGDTDSTMDGISTGGVLGGIAGLAVG
ncbi:MAG: general stress protein, partial [Thermacetogeniaceae bacterium]